MLQKRSLSNLATLYFCIGQSAGQGAGKCTPGLEVKDTSPSHSREVLLEMTGSMELIPPRVRLPVENVLVLWNMQGFSKDLLS